MDHGIRISGNGMSVARFIPVGCRWWSPFYLMIRKSIRKGGAKEFALCGRPLKEPMVRTGLPVVLSAVLSAIASGDGGSFSEGGSLLGLRSFSEVGGVDWRAGKWGLRGKRGAKEVPSEQ
jgi:hypothetical protein